MNRKQRNNDVSDSVSPPEIDKKPFRQENEFKSYLEEVFAIKNFKFKIHFFDKESPPSHVKFYSKSICIDDQTALSIHSSTLDQHRSFNWKKETRKRLKSEDCYVLYTFFVNKKRTDNEWQVKTVSYLKKKPNVKILKLEKENQFFAFELYNQVVGEKVGLVISPTCPWLCASPHGFCLQSKTLIKIHYFTDPENEGLTEIMQKLSYLRVHTDESNNIIYELKEKHALYVELQINMFFLNCQKSHLVLFNIKQNSLCKVEVIYNSEFVCKILSTLKTVYMCYFLNNIFDKLLTDAEKENFN